VGGKRLVKDPPASSSYRLVAPVEAPSARTVMTIQERLSRCAGVRKAWFTTLQGQEGDDILCVAIGLDLGVSVRGRQGFLDEFIAPLIPLADEIGRLQFFITDEELETRMSAGLGVAFFPSP
jgi:hypothetical protein